MERVGAVCDTEVDVPAVDASPHPGRRGAVVDDRTDVGKEAERIERPDNPCLVGWRFAGQAVEARREAVAVPEAAEAVELGVVAEGDDGVVERHSFGRGALSHAHREGLACEPVPPQGVFV